MRSTRREFFGYTGITLSAAAACGGSALEAVAQSPARTSPKRRSIGVSTYSFWQFRGERLGIPACIEKAAAMGFDGVEILHVQMQDESNVDAPEDQASGPLARPGADGLLDPPGVRLPRCRPAPDERPEDALPDRAGLPAGHPHDADQHGPLGDDQVVRRLHGQEGDRAGPRRATPRSRRSAGSSARSRSSCRGPRSAGSCWAWRTTGASAGPAEGVLRIVEAIKSPWLQMTLDTGNFLENSYEQMEAMASSKVPIALVQAKTYFGGGRWYGWIWITPRSPVF